MAAPICSVKSGRTRTELVAYNITVYYQDAATFFNNPQLSAVSPDILKASEPNDDSVYELLRTTDLSMSPALAEESAVNGFAVLLSLALGYAERKGFKDNEGLFSSFVLKIVRK
ncbi:uncharacterized protein EDB91DRAFT_602610 [Suillus paluster]|uniref:uncharacterized protein n=1 Tax=Suillus paluster TaxID=48578 RepID=UPI001B868735|nr:uncharacterized protein EDB91DRAFT_602610 [Suillus paluster]KAG1751366.1 hypothetical protein EDB91DRAFT_602610 [Suillus paluster]